MCVFFFLSCYDNQLDKHSTDIPITPYFHVASCVSLQELNYTSLC